MQFKSGFLSALAVSATTALRGCGMQDPTQEEIQLAQYMQAHEINARAMGVSFANKNGFNVNVYYHVIASSTDEFDGYISSSAVARQTQALNERFRPHNISWTQAGTDWTVEPQWSRNQNQHDMERSLRQGTYADMNVYILPSIDYVDGTYIDYVGSELEGYTSDFPQAVVPQSEAWYHDGIRIRSDTMPESTTGWDAYNLGMTLVHEAGHWLGLYHTFQGGCQGHGDGIDDTPAENPSFDLNQNGCDMNRDTCPGDGLDPVTNYMNYSDDSCYKEFTHGQEVRMYSQWAAFRASHQKL